MSKIELTLYDVALTVNAIESKLFNIKKDPRNHTDISGFEELLDKFKNTSIGIGEEDEQINVRNDTRRMASRPPKRNRRF